MDIFKEDNTAYEEQIKAIEFRLKSLKKGNLTIPEFIKLTQKMYDCNLDEQVSFKEQDILSPREQLECDRQEDDAKRLHWEKKRADVYFCYNKKDEPELLGRLCEEWVGRHQHWCWYQYQDIRMSPGCLEEVREKQKELFKLKRNKKC